MCTQISLLAGLSSSGIRIMEQVPAIHCGGPRYKVSATPGLARGCAEADVVSLSPDGSFVVEKRGGNLSIYINLVKPRMVDDLRAALGQLDARIEVAPDLAFAVITVAVSAGFAVIERAITKATARFENVQWYYGNVFDAQGKPLGWWVEEKL